MSKRASWEARAGQPISVLAMLLERPGEVEFRPLVTHTCGAADPNYALVLDDPLAEAHTSLAFVTLYYDRDWADAEREFWRAIELNPNYANGHTGTPSSCRWWAAMQTLIAESERARELDPLTILELAVGASGPTTGASFSILKA